MNIRFPRSLAGLALLSLLSAPALAQVQDGPAVDLKKLGDELKKIKVQQNSTSKAFVGKVVQDLRNAGASNGSAIAFYQAALMATKNETAADVQDIAKMESIQSAARVHLNYLVLTIQRALGATTQQLESGLNAHIAMIMQAGANDGAIWTRREKARALSDQGNRAANPTKGRMAADKEPMFCEQKLVTDAVKDSIFVKWYNIGFLVSDVKDWEMSPGNVDGIYQSTLLPYYRQTKDQRVLAYWDQKISAEGQKANATGSPFKIDQYNRIQRPQLLWNRAKDELAIGLKNKGIADMAELIRACPDHPDAADWISQVEAMLPGAPKPAGDASATPAAAQPSASQPAP